MTVNRTIADWIGARSLRGAISDAQVVATVKMDPMASPLIILPASSTPLDAAMNCTATPAAEMTEKPTMVYLRPMRSAMKPAMRPPRA